MCIQKNLHATHLITMKINSTQPNNSIKKFIYQKIKIISIKKLRGKKMKTLSKLKSNHLCRPKNKLKNTNFTQSTRKLHKRIVLIHNKLVARIEIEKKKKKLKNQLYSLFDFCLAFFFLLKKN